VCFGWSWRKLGRRYSRWADDFLRNFRGLGTETEVAAEACDQGADFPNIVVVGLSTENLTLKQIMLAPTVAGRFFIEYGDGTIDFELPNPWRSVISTYQATMTSRVSISAPPPVLDASNITLQDDGPPVRLDDTAKRSTQNLSDISTGHVQEPATDLHVHIDPPPQGMFYMPGMVINGWVRCNSGCFNHGSVSSLKSIRASLVGWCTVCIYHKLC
jgi:hypothetical protein